MINKLYEKTKQFIKENYFLLLFVSIIMLVCFIPMPFYIHAPGGIVDITKRVTVEDANSSKGSLNLAYVSEYKGTIPLYLYSLTQKEWDIVNIEEIVEVNETVSDSEKRSHMMLEEANQAAILNAFIHAGKKVTVLKEQYLVSYIDPASKNEFKIGDEIVSINNKTFQTKKDLQHYIKNCKSDERLSVTVLRDNKKMKLSVNTYLSDNGVKIGVVITSKKQLETNPNIKFDFKESESGPSGGMMMSLAIYNAISDLDITNGLKIAGTGTIDEDGNIGSIGGIEYKIMGSAKEKVDLFFAPAGENYKDAIKVKKKHNYTMNIVSVKTFQDVIDYLIK